MRGLSGTLALPRLRQGRNAQVGDREPGKAGLRAAAATGGALVADLAAGTGGRAGERRDRGRVVVGFHLDAERRVDGRFAAVALRVRVRAPARRGIAFHHRGVVAVGGEHVLGRARLGVLDHLEQRDRLRLPVDGPAGVEDLVPAVLGVGLREHHQFDVVRVAAQLGVARAQVFDLVVGQRQAEARVRRLQLRQRDDFHVTGGLGGEQRRAGVARGQQRLGHRVVQQPRQRRLLRPHRPASR